MGESYVMVVEDDPSIADLVDTYVSRLNLRVSKFPRAQSAFDAFKSRKPALIILDLGLSGDLDGLWLLKEIRAIGDVPILILTARDDELDKILGFELGTDDYMTKPFSPRELVARVKALLRRAGKESDENSNQVQINSIELDSRKRSCLVNGKEVELTVKEFDLAYFLASHRDIAFSRKDLLDAVWGTNWYGDERTVDVHVRQLRKKLGPDFTLVTVWGIGYRLSTSA